MFKKLDLIIKKNLVWIILLIGFVVWLKFDLSDNPLLPVENAHISKSLMNYVSDDLDIIYDKYATSLPSFLLNLGTMYNSHTGGRIVVLILSFIQLFFFFKFSKELLKNQDYAIFATLFLSLQSPLIFLGRMATSDMISLTFFTVFLWLFITQYNNNFEKGRFNNYFITLFFIMSIFSNLLIIIYLPVIFILMLKVNKKIAISFLTPVLLILILYITAEYNSFGYRIHLLTQSFTNDTPWQLSKLFVRIAEYIAIPIMLIFAASQILWKTDYKPEMLYLFVASSFIIPLYIFIFNDMFNIYRLIGYSLILLSPFAGMLIYKFLTMSTHYRYSTVFLLFFVTGVSYWNITKLESAFVDTNALKKYFETHELKKLNFYSEDPFLISSYFFGKVKEDNNLNMVIMRKSEISTLTKEQKENIIINKIKNGELDYVILNGLIHPELTERIKEKYLAAYQLVFSKEFQINTLLYPVSESKFEIYKIRDEFKIYKQFYAKKF